MRWTDVALLDDAGFSSYEKRALVTLLLHGVTDAATLCREGNIPTSKIYQALEKLAQLGLIEVQRSRPKLVAAHEPDVVVDRLVEIARERAADFASRAEELRRTLQSLPTRLKGRQTFADLALGAENHVKRHVARLAEARTRVLSYLEEGDLHAIEDATAGGFNPMKRIARHAAASGIQHRVIFGFSDRNAPRLLRFLEAHASSIAHFSGLRYCGELGHPFHVVDDEMVILSLDHPFVPEGRFASLLIRDRSLAERLAQGFDTLWERALRDLREIRFDPRIRQRRGPQDSST